MKRTTGEELLGRLVQEKDVTNFIDSHLTVDLFTSDNEATAFEFIEKHINKYGNIPDFSTIKKHTGISLKKEVEPFAFYADQLFTRYTHRKLRSALAGTREMLQDPTTVDEAVDLLADKVAELNMQRNRSRIIDFREAQGLILPAYLNKAKGSDAVGIKTGWNYLDSMNGGLQGGDVLSIIGRPASGKTFQTLYVAHNAWWEQNKPVLYVTMEMKPLPIFQRLAAMHNHLNMTNLSTARMSTKAFSKMKKGLTEINGAKNPLWVVDGNLAATVSEITLLARELQPALVVIDGAYLLKHPNSRVGRFEKVADNAEWIKQQLSSDCNVPVVSSYQFSREFSKAKAKGQKGGLEHIGSSDTIGQLSTIVLGLMEDESIETADTRLVDVMKGRNGEVGKFRINWKFKRMDFSEVVGSENGAEGSVDPKTLNYV